ncbi:MAG: hypothetical protein WA910_08155 [Sphingopyxis granuli]
MLYFLLMSPVPSWIPDPENLTEPIVHYQCEMVDERFDRHTLKFRREGGRGYWRAPGEAAVTSGKHVIEEDGMGLFSGMIEVPRPESERRGAYFRDTERIADASRAIVMEEVTPILKMLDDGLSWRASLVLTIDHGLRVERVVGFCDVRPEDQDPLDEKETRDLLAG